MGDDGAGIGDAGFGDVGFGVPDGGFSGGFGTPEGSGLGSGFGSGAGLAGIGFGDIGLSDSALGNALAALSQTTDLTDIGLDSFSFPDLSQGMPDVNMSDSSFLQDLSKSKVFQALQSFMPAPAKAAMSSNPAASLAQSGLAMGLSALGLGPIGGLAAAGLMGLTGANSAFAGASSQSSPTANEGQGMWDALPGLAGMYAGYRGASDAGKMLGGLQSLYGQDSPYAQAMRQALQRKDAASGRRSQYGPREVELQARLAQMASSQIPAMNALQQRQNMNRAMMLQQGIGAFNKMGGVNGLKDLFGMGGSGGLYDTAASNLMSSGGLSGMWGNMGQGMGGTLPADIGYNFDLGFDLG